MLIIPISSATYPAIPSGTGQPRSHNRFSPKDAGPPWNIGDRQLPLRRVGSGTSRTVAPAGDLIRKKKDPPVALLPQLLCHGASRLALKPL